MLLDTHMTNAEALKSEQASLIARKAELRYGMSEYDRVQQRLTRIAVELREAK